MTTKTQDGIVPAKSGTPYIVTHWGGSGWTAYTNMNPDVVYTFTTSQEISDFLDER